MATNTPVALVEYQKVQRARVIEKVERTMAAITAEVAANGKYIQNDGRLNKREFFRRAGIGESTLKNATHRETAKALENWLGCFKIQKPKVVEAPNAKGRRENQVHLIARNLDLFKIEYERMESKCLALANRVAVLERENLALKKSSERRVPQLKLVSDAEHGPTDETKF